MWERMNSHKDSTPPCADDEPSDWGLGLGQQPSLATWDMRAGLEFWLLPKSQNVLKQIPEAKLIQARVDLSVRLRLQECTGTSSLPTTVFTVSICTILTCLFPPKLLVLQWQIKWSLRNAATFIYFLLSNNRFNLLFRNNVKTCYPLETKDWWLFELSPFMPLHISFFFKSLHPVRTAHKPSPTQANQAAHLRTSRGNPRNLNMSCFGVFWGVLVISLLLSRVNL